jgi:nicotinamide mononucleotide adenylyltransferase
VTGTALLDQAFVCGRFQPPHNEHLEYLLEAKKRCRFLWIGIVRPDVHDMPESPDAVHRQAFHANPLTYFERVQILVRAMVDEGVAQNAFACTPFPLDGPQERLGDFMSREIPCFTTICEQWNEKKREKLVQAGYRVEVLFKRDPATKVEGQHIREAIVRQDSSWEALVPPATKDAVYRLGLRERLILKGLKA